LGESAKNDVGKSVPMRSRFVAADSRPVSRKSTTRWTTSQ